MPAVRKVWFPILVSMPAPRAPSAENNRWRADLQSPEPPGPFKSGHGLPEVGGPLIETLNSRGLASRAQDDAATCVHLGRWVRYWRAGGKPSRCHAPRDTGSSFTWRARGGDGGHLLHQSKTFPLRVCPTEAIDRKSTRLNSSH